MIYFLKWTMKSFAAWNMKPRKQGQPSHKMGNGQISKLSAEKKYSVRLAYVGKQELGNILHQFCDEQNKKRKEIQGFKPQHPERSTAQGLQYYGEHCIQHATPVIRSCVTVVVSWC